MKAYTKKFTEIKIDSEDNEISVNILVTKEVGAEVRVFINDKEFTVMQVYGQDPSYIREINNNIHNKIWDAIEAAERQTKI